MSLSPKSFIERLAEGYTKANATVDEGLLLAVSGGADSIALLHATHRLYGEQPERIRVAHVDHSLNHDSSQHAEFVAATSRKLGLEYDSLLIPPDVIVRQSEGSIEESARIRRYELLANVAARHNFRHVVTAHHRDDQVETVLHNIIRGTGLRGLRGMRITRPLSRQAQLIRPMLGLRRADVLAYLQSTSVDFCSDESNESPAFTRNRIRNELLPRLRRDVNEGVDENLVSLASQAAESLEVLDSLARQILTDAVLEQQPLVCRIDRAVLRRWPTAVVRHTLSVLWMQQSWPRQKMTTGHWQEIADALVGTDEATMDLPGDVRTLMSGNLVRFFRSPQ